MANATAVQLHFLDGQTEDGKPKYHMTTDGPELNALTVWQHNWTDSSDFSPKAFVFNQLVVGTVPLYRYRNRLSEDHFFTTSEAEGEHAIVKYDAVPEAICCYLSPTQVAGTIPLYRLLSDYGYHMYLTDANLRAESMALGWEDEGIAGFVWTAAVSLPAQ